MCRNFKMQKGFTMLELSVVIVIISILAAALISSRGIIRKGNLASARQMTANAPVTHIDGLALWLETSLNDSVEFNLATNTVTTWRDLSGGGRDLTTDTGTPLYDESGNVLGGIPVIIFSGGESLSYSEPIPSEQHTFFVVFYVEDSVGNQSIFYNGNPSVDGWGIERDSGNSIKIKYDTSEGTIQQYDNRPGVFVGRYGGGEGLETAHYKVNGGSITALGALNGLVAFPSDSSGEISVGGTDMDLELVEVIVYDRDLFASEVNDIVDYLLRKYDINY